MNRSAFGALPTFVTLLAITSGLLLQAFVFLRSTFEMFHPRHRSKLQKFHLRRP